ncbi:MAG: methyltransferase [Alistipes sp.]|nr:methyltransferase [Alistipes sp.]
MRLTGAEHRLLDIGTGTGVIALMLAQRTTEAEVTAIDIDSVEEARYNFSESPWADRLTAHQQAVQHFDAESFDVIVSNPPYFVDALLCPDEGRTTARHTVSLSFEELRDAVCRLLKTEGRFAVVLPTQEAARFERVCCGKLTPVRRTEVRTTPRHAPKRVLLELMHSEAVTASAVCDELTIGTGCHEEFTPQYRALTHDFYLKF